METAKKSVSWKLRFWSIFTGQTISLIGSSLTQFVLLWWITDTTGSVAALGYAGLAAMLPQALLGTLGGICADRYNRRLIMIFSDLISAAAIGVLLVLFANNEAELCHVYIIMAIRSSMQAFQQPAAASSTVMLIPENFITRVAGLNQITYGIMTVGAAPLGALALSIMPLGWALSIDILTAILGILPLLFYKIPQNKPLKNGKSGAFIEFKEGIFIVWHHPVLRRMYALETAIIMIIMPSFTLIPLLVKNHFGGGAEQVALIESLSGVGMVAGGIFITILNPAKRIRCALTGMFLACFALAATGLPSGSCFGWAAFFWAAGSFAYVVGNAPFTAFIQSSIPNELQGRALSLLSVMTGSSAPLGIALATPLGEAIGVRWLFVCLGLGGGLIALSGFASSALRGHD